MHHLHSIPVLKSVWYEIYPDHTIFFQYSIFRPVVLMISVLMASAVLCRVGSPLLHMRLWSKDVLPIPIIALCLFQGQLDLSPVHCLIRTIDHANVNLTHCFQPALYRLLAIVSSICMITKLSQRVKCTVCYPVIVGMINRIKWY